MKVCKIEKIVNFKDTFFVEMNDDAKKEIMKTKLDISKKSAIQPLNYRFNDSQREFDKNITEAMSKGEEYSEIEEKFINQLKK